MQPSNDPKAAQLVNINISQPTDSSESDNEQIKENKEGEEIQNE